jgi:hypothetical protein
MIFDFLWFNTYKLKNTAHLSLVLILAIILFGNQTWADTEIVPSTHKENQISLERLLGEYSQECRQAQGNDISGDLEVDEDTIRHVFLRQGNTPLTIFSASFYCPGVGSIWSGTAGYPTFLIVKNQIFDIVPGWPIPIDINDEITVLVNWHNGDHCVNTRGSVVSKPSPCFSVLFWDPQTNNFSFYDTDVLIRKSVN